MYWLEAVRGIDPVRVCLYQSESNIASRWVYRESNLIVKLSSDKDQGKRRMHSSRMRTARSLTISGDEQGVQGRGACMARGACVPGGSMHGRGGHVWQSVPRTHPPPPISGQNDRRM